MALHRHIWEPRGRSHPASLLQLSLENTAKPKASQGLILVIIYNSSHGISAYILKPRNFNLTVYMFQDKSFWLPTGAAQSVTVNLSKLLRTETAEGSRNDANRRSCSDSVTYQLVLHFYCGSKVDRVCKCKGKKFLFWKNTPF